jgi:hypothetical protein
VSEQNLSDNFFTNEENSVPIPPADQAWTAMQQQLDKAMPVKAPGSAMKALLKNALISGTAVTISATSLWLYVAHKHAADKHPTVVSPVTDSPDTDTISENNDTALSSIQSPLSNDSSSQDKNTHTAGINAADPANAANEQSVMAAGEKIMQKHSDTALLKTTIQYPGSNAVTASTPSGTPVSATTLAASTAGKGKRPVVIAQYPTTNTTGKNTTNQQPITAASNTVIPPANTARKGKRPAIIAQDAAGQKTGKPLDVAKRYSGEQPPTPPADRHTVDESTPQLPATSSSNTPPVLHAGNKQQTVTPQLPADGKPPAASGVTVHKWILEPIRQPDQSRNIRLSEKKGTLDNLQVAHVTKTGKENNSLWHLYGQLNIAAPLQGSSYYLLGPQGKNQFYRGLIPILRVEKTFGKRAVSVDAIPMLSAIVADSLHYLANASGSFPSYDTSISVVKQFGYGFALQYHYAVLPRLKISAGGQFSIFSKATVRQSETNDSTGLSSAEHNRAASAAVLDSLTRTRISGVFEVYYDFGKWQTGVKAIVPFNGTGPKRNWELKTPVQIELLIRRRLISR